MQAEFINLNNAYKYFYRQAAKRPIYVGLLFNYFDGVYEVLFSPPKETGYEVIKLHGTV